MSVARLKLPENTQLLKECRGSANGGFDLKISRLFYMQVCASKVVISTVGVRQKILKFKEMTLIQTSTTLEWLNRFVPDKFSLDGMILGYLKLLSIVKSG